MNYADDGQRCFAPIGGEWLPVDVACAAGRDARVVNEALGIDRWFDVRELRLAGTLYCPTCSFEVPAHELEGPHDCPKLLSNEERAELGLEIVGVPPHLAALGIVMSKGGICNTPLKHREEQ